MGLEPDELQLLDAWWRAANYLSVGRPSAGQPSAQRAASPRTCKAPPPRRLGHHPGAELHLRPPESGNKARDLNAIYITGPGHGGPGGGLRISRRHLHGGLPDDRTRRGRAASSVSSVLVSRRHPQPRGPETPGSIHEGGELGYPLLTRLRRSARQSGPAGRCAWIGRRGGRDRGAGRQLAFEQVPQPGRSTGRCCPSCI